MNRRQLLSAALALPAAAAVTSAAPVAAECELGSLDGWIPTAGGMEPLSPAALQELVDHLRRWNLFSGDYIILAGDTDERAEPSPSAVSILQAERSRSSGTP